MFEFEKIDLENILVIIALSASLVMAIFMAWTIWP